MSDSDHIILKRRVYSSKCTLDAKEFKERQGLKKENESSNKVRLSDEELSMVFELPNITFNIDGKKLHLNKEQLVSASPVFDKMLNSDFKEAKLTEIPLPGKNVGHMVRFLRFILPGFTDELTEDTVYDMLHLAEEYQTEALKERIDIFLAKYVGEKSDKIRSSEIVEFLLEAELYKLSRYLDQCKDVAAKKLSQNLTKCQGYQDISQDTRFQIYTMRCNLLDACLASGTVYNPKKSFTPKNSIFWSHSGNQEFTTDSIHVGMHRTVGEKLKGYLQNN